MSVTVSESLESEGETGRRSTSETKTIEIPLGYKAVGATAAFYTIPWHKSPRGDYDVQATVAGKTITDQNTIFMGRFLMKSRLREKSGLDIPVAAFAVFFCRSMFIVKLTKRGEDTMAARCLRPDHAGVRGDEGPTAKRKRWARDIQQDGQRFGRNPAENRRIEREELKKLILQNVSSAHRKISQETSMLSVEDGRTGCCTSFQPAGTASMCSSSSKPLNGNT